MAKARTKSSSKTRSKIKTKAKKTAAKRAKAKSKAGEGFVVSSKRKHKFVATPFRVEDFKSDGLRPYALYRDLGIKDATRGMAIAHVIKLIGRCDPKVVSKLHTHEADFQMIYVLKGSLIGEYEGHGVYTLNEGDCWLQPKNIKHKVLDYTDGCELLEIVMPAEFKTVELEK
jgi:mannose-6-phosphate isomerase-like protein (cupin superfamily)